MNNDLEAKYRNEIMQYYEMRKKKEAELNKTVLTNAEPQNIIQNAQNRYPVRQNRSDISDNMYSEPRNRSGISDNMYSEPRNRSGISDNMYSEPQNRSGVSDNMYSEPRNRSGISDNMYSEPQNRSGVSDNMYSEPRNRIGSIEDRYPEPRLPGYISQPEDFPKDITGDNYRGNVRAQVTTGEGALPVEDAFVIISSVSSGNGRELIAALLTNKSGGTVPIAVITPQATLSTDIPYSVVDVLVYKDGFYSFQNKDVSVYSGTTSIQPVNLVPLPASSQPKKFVYGEGNKGQTDNTNQIGPIETKKTTDQINQNSEINQSNQINQMDQTNKTNQTNQTNQFNPMNQTNRMNQQNQFNRMNQTNQTNRMSQTNRMNRTNQNNNS